VGKKGRKKLNHESWKEEQNFGKIEKRKDGCIHD
jgi:hypothetical protein